MKVVNKIRDYIISNDIENAYNIIMENEKEYINNSSYWNLRGILCSKIREYNAAINCFKTAIKIDINNYDAWFNILYTYNESGQLLQAALHAGIGLRYITDKELVDDIHSIYINEKFGDEYGRIVEEIKNNNAITIHNLDMSKYIASKFKNIDEEYIEIMYKNDITSNWAYFENSNFITYNGIKSIEEINLSQKTDKYDLIIPYDVKYIEVIRNLAFKGIKRCYILVATKDNKFELIEITSNEMLSLKNKEYKRTISLNRFNWADANVYALIKYMPKKYLGKYKLNVIKGREVFNIENIIKVPLISSITVSGFNTFVRYPKFTYNIDVGHASVIIKNCGIMDKKYKNFAFTPQEYEKIDKVFITSKMNMLMQSAFSAIPENKYEITGNPRTDTLLLSDGKNNLELLLEKKIDGKKIIFNMPTFHIHENSGIVNGTNFNDSFKINNFEYEKFNKFLMENNIICISKVHHAEERVITEKVKDKKLENLIFISNKDLEDKGLDLYEILNCADGLITDYSSIYGDFLFMNKPIVFVNIDIEEYREERGISLEPYDFWTAGPKVQTQDGLEKELLKSLLDESYYKQKREELRDVFYEFKDSNSTLRVWEHIDKVFKSITKEKVGV